MSNEGKPTLFLKIQYLNKVQNKLEASDYEALLERYQDTSWFKDILCETKKLERVPVYNSWRARHCLGFHLTYFYLSVNSKFTVLLGTVECLFIIDLPAYSEDSKRVQGTKLYCVHLCTQLHKCLLNKAYS